MLLASCVLGDQFDFKGDQGSDGLQSGQTLKVKRDLAGFMALVYAGSKDVTDLSDWLRTPTVIDRQATKSNPGRHFFVYRGRLELEGVTLKGGYSVSFRDFASGEWCGICLTFISCALFFLCRFSFCLLYTYRRVL